MLEKSEIPDDKILVDLWISPFVLASLTAALETSFQGVKTIRKFGYYSLNTAYST